MKSLVFIVAISYVLISCAPPQPASKRKQLSDSLFITSKVVTPLPTAVLEKQKSVEKPLPAVTKFKVSDKVCAWGKVTGVVRKINWSINDNSVLVYEIFVYDDTYMNKETVEYYESELVAGECN
jgi:hypothetical protein